MSSFGVYAYPVTVETHPNADALDLISVGGFRAVAKRGQFLTGETALYLPTDSVLPESLLWELGFWDEHRCKGTLAGKKGNRIKPIRLRGELSEGVVISIAYVGGKVQPGIDYAEALGVHKYVPTIPEGFDGELQVADIHRMWETENAKSPGSTDIFQPSDFVWVTEKIHGSCLVASLVSEDRKIQSGQIGRFTVSSKGRSGKSLSILEAPGNAYWSTVRNTYLEEFMQFLFDSRENFEGHNVERISVFGEVFGPGVQDMHYGQNRKRLMIFSIIVEDSSGTHCFDPGHIKSFIAQWEYSRRPGIEEKAVPLLPPVVIIYGLYGQLAPQLHEMCQGTTRLMPEDETHIREGIVVSRYDVGVGKPTVLKWINPDYLTRKGGTEYQ